MPKWEKYKEHGEIMIKNARKQNFEKPACQKAVCQENVKLFGPRYVIKVYLTPNFLFAKLKYQKYHIC